MDAFATWVANAAGKLPSYLRFDPLVGAAVPAVALWLLDQQFPEGPLRLAIPVMGGVLGYIGMLALRGKFSGAKAEPVTALMQWDGQRRRDGLPPAPASLEAAADDWGKIDRALDTSLWKGDPITPQVRRACDTGMLSIALSHGGSEPEAEREADMSALAAALDRFGGQKEAGALSVEATSRITEITSRLDAPRLARFTK